jgi:hypothetical protein
MKSNLFQDTQIEGSSTNNNYVGCGCKSHSNKINVWDCANKLVTILSVIVLTFGAISLIKKI